MGSLREEVDELLMFEVFSGFFLIFCWKILAKTFAPTFCVVLCDHDGVVSSTSRNRTSGSDFL